MAFVREHGVVLAFEAPSEFLVPGDPAITADQRDADLVLRLVLEAREQIGRRVMHHLERDRRLLSLPKLPRIERLAYERLQRADGEHTDHLVLPVQGEAQGAEAAASACPACDDPTCLR